MRPSTTIITTVPTEHLAPLLDYAERVLGRDLDRFLDTGTVPGSLHYGGSSAPQEPAFQFRRHGVMIQPLTAEEAASEDAWHGYWRPREYRNLRGLHIPDGALPQGSPPRPLGRNGPAYELTWARVRPLLAARRDSRRGETANGQLDLFAAAGLAS